MMVPFMRSYTERLIQVCHQHGAHAMGGMAAFIPSRKDENVNKMAFEKVRQDKEREVADGFDGTWVAHPDLVPFAKEIFMKVGLIHVKNFHNWSVLYKTVWDQSVSSYRCKCTSYTLDPLEEVCSLRII